MHERQNYALLSNIKEQKQLRWVEILHTDSCVIILKCNGASWQGLVLDAIPA